jgi:ABC-2 type transport system ATP-binding protein
LGKKKLIRDLSRGNQQKIGVATALMANPEVLVLDEPFNSLDPSSQFRLKNMLGKLKQEKQVTMLISSHDLNHVNEVCDRIAILEKGIIVKDLRKTDKTLQELQSYFAV